MLLTSLTKRSLTELELNRIQVQIESMCKSLRSLLPKFIYLFGSAAANKLTNQSDIDFLIVFDDTESLMEKKREFSLMKKRGKMPVDIIWMSLSEFERKKDLGGVAMSAYQEGTCLYRS